MKGYLFTKDGTPQEFKPIGAPESSIKEALDGMVASGQVQGYLIVMDKQKEVKKDVDVCSK